MKEQQHNKTFTSSDIERYLNKELTPGEMHAMEKAALEDPFLADAMEGYNDAASTGEMKSISADLDDLKGRLKARTSETVEEKRVVAMNGNYWWRIAAGIMLIAGTAGIVYTVIHTAAEPGANQVAKHEVAPTRPPSASASTADTASFATEIPNVREDVQPGKPAAATSGSNNEVVSQKMVDQNAEKKQLQAKDLQGQSAAVETEVVQADAARSTVRTESKFEGSQHKEITATAPPTARQRNDVFLDQAATNARVYSPFAANNFTGKVVDRDNKPIAGASVIVLNKNVGVSTDKEGQFNMILPDSNIQVKVASVGFEPASLTLRHNLVDNRIVLQPSERELSEVVVTGYSTKRKTAVTANATAPLLPAPANGWDAYETYLEKNKRRSLIDTVTAGTVVVSFTINKNGMPTNLKIEKSLKSALDAEALRLVKEGPAWKPGKKKTRGRVSISF